MSHFSVLGGQSIRADIEIWSGFHFAKMHHFVFKDMNGILKTKKCQVYALLI